MNAVTARAGRSFPLLVLLCLLFAAYVAMGRALAAQGVFAPEYDNLLFHADCPRVVENTTSLFGGQWRTRVHPLQVLLVAPWGGMLAWLLSSADLAAVVIAALFAVGTLLNLDALLRRATTLTAAERLLFVAFLGTSASHATFGAVPETHIMSAFGLSLMARHLSSENLERLRASSESVLAWLRAGGARGLAWATVAIGAQITSFALIPRYVLLQLSPKESFVRRAKRMIVIGAGLVAVVGVLHGAQRVFRTLPAEPAPSASVTAAPSPSVALASRPDHAAGRPDTAASETQLAGVQSHFQFFTRPSALPERVAQMTVLTFGITFYAPKLVFALWEGQRHEAMLFDYLQPSFRPVGWVGLTAWLGLLAISLVVVLRGKGLRELAATPAFVFCCEATLLYFAVFCLYGDELFLFSPNWAFPLVAVAALLYGRAAVLGGRSVRATLAVLLALATSFAIVNSALHLKDMLAVHA